MNKSTFLIALILCGRAFSNDALDLLEGRKDASEITVPPSPEGTAPASADGRKITYPEQQWPPSPLDPYWQRTILHSDPDNPYLQKVALTGLFEWQGAWGKTNSNDGDRNLDNTRTRRARLGARMRIFRNTDIEATGEFAGDSDHHGVERLSGTTEIRPDTSVTYGKFRPTFGTEYRTPDELLPYHDRSLLSNLLAPASTIGIAANYKRGEWDFALAWFSNDFDPYIPSIEGPGFLNLGISKTVSRMSGNQPTRTRWHLDYVHNLDPDGSETIPRFDVKGRRSANGNQLVTSNPAFRHLLSTGVTLESPTYGFSGDFMWGRGDTTVWGMNLSPYYWAIPGRLKIVGRYHFADSDDPGALITSLGASSDPYFDDSPFIVGDEFHSFYLGANWHIDQNRLVLMGGLEYSDMKDDSGGGAGFDSWIWHTGARLSF